jgi:hypothetical protein
MLGLDKQLAFVARGDRPEDLEKFSGPGRFRDPRESNASPKDLPQKVRPIPQKD